MINPRTKKAFDKYLEEQNKPKTYNYGYSYPYTSGYKPGSGYNSATTPVTSMDYATIYFYEWSNLRQGAKTFNSKKEFFKMLNDCKINFTESQKKDIEETRYKTIFATCVPNKPQLMTSDTWFNLNKLVESYVDVNKT